MSNEYVVHIPPLSWGRAKSPSLLSTAEVDYSNSMACRRLLKNDADGYIAEVNIPANLTVGTGVTLAIPLVDDGRSSADLGKVVRVGVTVKKLAGGTDTYDIGTSAGTEQTVDVTLNGTSGVRVVGSLAIANANLDSAGAGDTVLIRLRRVGTASQDTCAGAVLLGTVQVKNT